MNPIQNFLAAAFGQGPLDPLDIRNIWLAVAVIVGLAAIGLVVWRSIVGWRERISEKEAAKALKERESAAKPEDAFSEATTEMKQTEQSEQAN